MKNQKYLYLVFIFLVILISIQAVSASDDFRGDIISADDEGLILEDSINEDISTAANDNEELFLDESIEEDVSTGANDDELFLDESIDEDVSTGANDDELFLDESEEDTLGSADEETVLKESPGSFSDLNNFINVENAENTTIHLSKNYAYTDSDEDKNYVHGVSISRGLTIEGHGVTIDGAHLARIFNVGKVYVTIRNINFINGNAIGTGLEIHGGAIYCPYSGYCVAEYCNFTNNTAQTGGGHGGALFCVNANNCYFTENKAASLGGAIYSGDATNCNFTSNTAYKGGAIYDGDATNCNFTSNTATYGGGAIYYGSATNCNFTSNNATYEGGAIYKGDATNCNFTSNTATYGGGAIYGDEDEPTYYKAVFCALDDQSLSDFVYVEFIVPDFIVSDLTTKYNSGEKLLFNLTYGEERYDGYNATITITQNGNPIGTFYGLTGESGGWIVDLPGGVYNATLSLEKYAVEPVTVTITVKKPTFWDLNKTINGNDNATVYLSTNYTFDEATDSSFYHGVEISRALTIEGNGVTIDGAHLARIFNVKWVKVTIRNINFINGNATGTGYDMHGGAIYCPNSGSCVAEYCNFTNNTAQTNGGQGGALFRIKANNCYFTENKAANLGGAIYGGDATNCNFTSNTATDGGAIFMGDATNCNFTSNNAYKGGAIYHGDATNCNFTSNTATYGGAIYYGSATNCNFTENTATVEGGAIYGDYNEPTYYKAVFCALDDQSLSDFAYVDIVPDFIVSDLTTKYGSGENLLFNLTYGEENYDGYNATITITQNGNPISTFNGLTGEDGGWIVDLPGGVYNATLSLEKYAVEPVTVTITVTKAPTNVTVDCDDEITLNQGETSKINAALTPNVGQLSYSSSDDSVVSIDQEGNIITHNAGTALITISFAENENYTASSKTVKVTVKQIPTEITAPSITATYNVNKDLVITLKDSKGNALSGFKVSVDLNGAKEYTTDDKGTIIVPTKGLNAGTYTAKIAFAGTRNYAGSSATAKVTVNKDSPKITAASVSTTYNVNKNLIVTLKDSLGNALSGVKVTVKIASSKKYTTDKNGQIKVAIGKLVPKAYTAKISFAGNANYNGASATAKVTVKKAVPKMTAKAKTYKFEDKTKKYKVTLKDNKGKALKNAKITLKVKGKTYTAKTNSKGVATFKLKKLSKNGKYSAVIKYAGDKYYKKLTKKVKITVKKPAWKTVSKGSKDKATVKKIQRALKDNGYYLSYKGRYLKIDGLYHKYTVRAVKQFQKAKGLKVSGKVDYKTAKKLKII